MKLIFTIFLTFLLSTPIFAQLDENPANWCRNGLFPRENIDFKLGTIKARKGEKVYFFSDDDDCPNGKKCQKKSYLIANDEVLVSRTFGDFSCVWYQPKKGAETVGWIKSDKLEFVQMLQSIEDYVGKWFFYDNEIEIVKTETPSVFKVSGTAFWKGLGDNIHTGELGGEAVWDETKLLYGENEKGEYACKASLDLIGSFLIVSDNLNCGGANVTFSGVYRKAKAKK